MISSFSGAARFLSNFYPARVEYDGEVYESVEHAYQAAKTLDRRERQMIQRVEKPGQAKRLGRDVTMRKDWDVVKIGIMRDLVKQKFQHQQLKALLLATGDEELVEGNYWGDRFWGVCGGTGRNELGKILMAVRETLR